MAKASTTAVAALATKRVGKPVKLSISVTTFAPTAGVPTGTETVSEGAISIVTVALDAGGKASVITSSLMVGTHQMSVTFFGDADHATSSASATVTTSSPHQAAREG